MSRNSTTRVVERPFDEIPGPARIIGARAERFHHPLIDGVLREQVNVLDGPRLAGSVDASKALN